MLCRPHPLARTPLPHATIAVRGARRPKGEAGPQRVKRYIQEIRLERALK
jgi:hypothetical protein